MKDTDDKPNVYSWNPCTKFKEPGTNCEDALVSHFKFDFGLDKPEFCNSSLNCVLLCSYLPISQLGKRK